MNRKWYWLATFAAALAIAAAVWFFRSHPLAPGGEPPVVDVYFVRFDRATNEIRLARRERPVSRKLVTTGPAGGAPTVEQLRVALEELLQGPTPQEKRDGLESEIPVGTKLRNLRVSRRVAFVDLDSTFESGGGTASVRARVAQLVYTATQYPEIADKVRIMIDGQMPEAITGEGYIVEEPLTRQDVGDRF
ncbi:MAG TPA: GerMN domain-containing protein [Firmicutes bacterium]|nr:GerMN domain-containing protein [Bacillota bacterium]